MATYYLVGSGNWSNPAIWSLTSGGTGGAGVPGINDYAYVNQFTVSASSDIYARYIQNDTGTFNLNGYNLYVALSININGGFVNFGTGIVTIGGIQGDGGVKFSGSLGVSGVNPSINALDCRVIINAVEPSITRSSSLTPSKQLTINNLEVNLGETGSNASTKISIGRNLTVNYLKISKLNTSNHELSVVNNFSVRKFIIHGESIANNKILLYSSVSGSQSQINVVGSNQLIAADYLIITDVAVNGSGNYYAGSNSVTTGTAPNWIFSDAPKVETLSDNFSGNLINSAKWNSTGTVAQFGGWIGSSSFGTTRTGTLTSVNQYLGEGSFVKFKQKIDLGSSVTAYFANAFSQYGVTARRNIPDIYVTLTSSTGQFFISAHTTYTSTTFDNNYLYYRIRESSGTIYLDGSNDGISYTNIKSALASNYGLDATQLISRPMFNFTSNNVSSASIGAFNVEQEPTAVFVGTPVSGNTPLSVQFTDQSNFTPTSWSWAFGDGATSTLQNPSKTYNAPGTYNVSLTASNSSYTRSLTRTGYITVSPNVYQASLTGTLVMGGSVSRKLLGKRSISGTLVFGGSLRGVLLRDVEGIQDKRYLYKVYDEEGNYIETWRDVISELNYTHEINTIGSTTQIELARNSDTMGVSSSPLMTESGENILTEDGFDILVTTESKNQIGSGSSVDYNNRVDITVFYGSVEPLLTEDDEPLLTENDEELLADVGAPNGRRIFTGFISEINSRYGSSETTLVQLSSYGWDLAQFPLTDSLGKTTVTFNSFDPSNIAKFAIDKFQTDSEPYNTYTTRTETSISDTGTVVSYTFRANTYEDVVNKTLELMPSNWYYRVGLGDNITYYRQRSATPQHTFYLGKHIKALDLKGSILNSTNRVLFTGGGDPALYIDRSEAPASRTRRTLSVTSDNRVTVLDSANIIAEGQLEEANKVLYRTSIEILSKQYDIESIDVGQTVGFRNFGNYVDSLVMQIVGISYNPDSVQLQLETKPPTINKRLADIQRNLTVTENQNVPNQPS